MKEDLASSAAMHTAKARACHQVMDYPKVFDDPLATTVVGAAAMQECIRQPLEAQDMVGAACRAELVAESRVVEDSLCDAVARGVAQYVVLGAGLDTFAYRNPYGSSALQVFEVDHPAIQAWKRQRLRESNIHEPASLAFVAIDLARQTLPEALAMAGLRADRPTFFSWLGGTMFLPPATVMQVLRYIASLPRGSGVAFDFTYRPARWNLTKRLMLIVSSRRGLRSGQQRVGFLEPQRLVDDMGELGFSATRHVTRHEMNGALFAGRDDELRIRVEGMGGMIVATV